jgi:hypothetical protein
VVVAVWPGFARAAPSASPPTTSDRHRVLLLVDEPGDHFMDLVRAEVSSVRGVDIVVRAPMGTLEADARAERAEAAIRKLASGKGVEVWMADVTSGRSLLRQAIVDESPDGPDQSLVALQTAELLRTSFLPRHEPASAAPRPTSAATAPSPNANAVTVGVGLLGTRGGVSPALQAWLSYQHLGFRHFGLVFEVSAPLVRGSVSRPQGSAEVGAVVAGGGLCARVRSDGGRMFLATSLVGALAAVLVNGRPAANFAGTSPTAYAGLFVLRASGGVYATRWLGLGVAGIFGTTTSRVRIQFANEDVGEWGMPIAAGLLFAEVGW